MSTLKRYKDFEKRLYGQSASAFKTLIKAFARFFTGIIPFLRRKYTLMLVPHNGGSMKSIQVSRFTLILGIIVGFGFVSAASFLTVRYARVAIALGSETNNFHRAQGDLDRLRDEAGRVAKVADRFENALDSTLSSLGVDKESGRVAQTPAHDDISKFFQQRAPVGDSLTEIYDMRALGDLIERSSEKVKQLEQYTGTRYGLNDIPTIWPIKGGIGMISMYFGQNRNAFTGLWYIHNGVDIITYGSGDPIVATADGEVIQVRYDANYGNYVTIKHQFGFFTRYAHMQSTRVGQGQKVQQGQIIGYVGNTGQTTGPHLHYEVHLGTSVVDPIKYLKGPKPKAVAPAGNL